ncbi:SCO family protein [Undibacterium sp. TJN19]|uniref:SCO family protein n=1 Tax=Undibacterium sp. TJN19 TaxID=3413055 RepID=UPI003BEFA60B
MQRRSFIRALTPLILGAGLVTLAGCQRRAEKFTAIDITGAPYGQALQLQGSDGRAHSLADFKGQYVMLFFGFTQCPDICPTALTRAVNIRKQLGADGKRVQVLFVTIDPERDTQELLAEYMRAFDPSFLGLRGSLAETAQVAKDFKVFYEKIPNGSSYTMDHTAITYVFDAAGRIRLAFKHEQTAAQCAQDLRTLMQSASTLL